LTIGIFMLDARSPHIPVGSGHAGTFEFPAGILTVNAASPGREHPASAGVPRATGLPLRLA
jgi:hypothetical protein